jgi:hypothetical protein
MADLEIDVRVVGFGRYHLPRWAATGLLFALPVCLTVILVILRTLAAHDVRGDGRYVAMYGLMGAAWVGMIPGVLPTGISTRDDFLERRNASAAYAVLGLMLGSTFCYAGGNIGDGPGWWVVVFSAFLANGVLALLWGMANQFAPVVERITVDRDPAMGARAGGFFAGSGLVLGRAVAGDWVSLGATVQDFVRTGWPVLLLWMVFVLTERWAKPRYKPHEYMTTTRGLLPALFYLLAGMLIVLAQGPVQ